jgi:uncharacterized protein (DUF1800 family)
VADLLEGRAAVAHLLRRAGFGPSPKDRETLLRLPYGDAVARLLEGLDAPVPADPAGFDPYVPGAIQQTWLDRMASSEAPLAERLSLFWHGHFATSDAKIQDASLLWTQHRLFRGSGRLRFPDLVLAVSRDVAMVRWLDGNSNRAGHPNENYAREVQELFTLGRGNYSESDVREIARAFTGWGSRHHEFVYTAAFHDDGTKTFHGETGPFGGEDAVRILTALPACHRFLARKLLAHFSHPEPTDAEAAAVARVLEESGGDVRAALEAIFRAPRFRDRERHRALVRSPVEFVVAAVRACGATTVPAWTAQESLDRMGQILFRPPSVKGWTSGTGWLTAGAVVERLRTAQRLSREAPEAAARDVEDVAFDGDTPKAVAESLKGLEGADRIAAVLGSPEFQLA